MNSYVLIVILDTGVQFTTYAGGDNEKQARRKTARDTKGIVLSCVQL